MPFRKANLPINDIDATAIPYAAPPVGQLRYKAPQALATQNSTVQDVSQDFPGVEKACVQFGTTNYVGVNAGPGVEDCLYVRHLRLNLSISVLSTSYGSSTYGHPQTQRRVTSLLSACLRTAVECVRLVIARSDMSTDVFVQKTVKVRTTIC